MRVGAAVMTDGHGLAAPNQLGAAPAEVLPAPDRQVARLAVGRAVPALHRQHAEPVADTHAIDLERLRERRCGRRRQLAIEAEPDAGAARCRSNASGVRIAATRG